MEDDGMAIDTVRAGRLRWAALAAFALATLSVIGRERHTVLPPSRPLARPPAAAPPTAAPPAVAPVPAPALRGGPRGLSCAALSLVVPGAGQIHGGARTRGAVMLGVVVALLIGALVLARQDVAFLVGQALRTEVLLGSLALNGAVLLFRGGAVADAWRLGTRPARRAARAALLAALLAIVAVPHALAAWYQWSAYDAVTTIFADVEPEDILAGVPYGGTAGGDPRQDLVQALEARARAEAEAAWPPGGRLTVLLLGGDAGPGRSGLRTDTMVVATVHEESRRAALLSLPRNMGGVPLPPAAAGLVPDGRFPDILNALYGWAGRYPDRFPGRDPGATALKQVAANLTGLRVDYYALVDFRGFVEMVDALGGVTINVPRPVLDRVSPPEDGQDWIRIDLQPGRQKLTAHETFAYVRARSYSSDYDRIRRQRCVMVALAEQADPARVLRSFPRLARAARQNVSTDIPRRVLPQLVELVAGIDRRKVVSLGFVPPAYTTGDGAGYPVPDIPAIRAATRKAISPGGVRGAPTLGGEVCT
jgi:polyisoprenyl-teichoic acid--peptidoglycan teichoic acid transferase